MQKEKFRKIICHPLTLVIAIFLIVHVFNITRFDFLAEKDSYGWLLKYEDNLRYDTINDYRQLFSALLISIHHLTGLELFDIFKYLMPLSFIVAFIPLWLIARNLKKKSSQLLILLAPLGSATIILQMEGTRPQTMAMFFLYFSLGIVMLAKKKENENFAMILLGLLSVVGSLFHRVFVIFLLIWIITILYNYRKFILQNKMKFFVLVFLAIPWLEKVQAKSMVLMAFKSVKEIFEKIFIHPQFNFRFPAHYVNIDEIQMGWNNLAGVAKYYAFYAGPFFLAILFLVAMLILFSEKFRKFLKETAIKKEFLFVYLLILFFLFIAEILPRIGNIAYLPDRAWVFLGILLILPLYFLLDYAEKEFSRQRITNTSFMLFIFLAISIFGGIYVNNSMKNIIPAYKMESYVWIKDNIEQGGLFFSAGYTGALKYHSSMNVLAVSRNIFKDDDLSKLVNILRLNNKNQFDKIIFKEKLNLLDSKVISVKSILAERELSFADLTSEIKKVKTITDELFLQVKSSTVIDTSKPVYIYFSKDKEENPYRERASSTGEYYSGTEQSDMKLLYDHPEYFAKVYDTGSVVIWKFISN